MDFIDKIRKIIKMRHDDVVVTMTSGGVDNMEKYNYMLGQIRTYQYLLQEISTLLAVSYTHLTLPTKRIV